VKFNYVLVLAKKRKPIRGFDFFFRSFLWFISWDVLLQEAFIKDRPDFFRPEPPGRPITLNDLPAILSLFDSFHPHSSLYLTLLEPKDQVLSSFEKINTTGHR
jgi:hypothetical protein